MRTKLFIVLLLTLGLVTMGAMVSFADVSDTATISADVLPGEYVAMGDVVFGTISSGRPTAIPEGPALTFSSNYASNVLRIWTANVEGPGMVSGTDTIPLRYYFDLAGGTHTMPITDVTWGTEWTAVSNVPATPDVLYTGGPIDKSMPGAATLEFATEIDEATAPGSYSTVLNLEIIRL